MSDRIHFVYEDKRLRFVNLPDISYGYIHMEIDFDDRTAESEREIVAFATRVESLLNGDSLPQQLEDDRKRVMAERDSYKLRLIELGDME